MEKCSRGTVDFRRGTATPLWLLKSQTSRFYRHQIFFINSRKMIAYISLFLSLVSIIIYFRGKLPIPEQWLFLLKGRRILIDRTEKVSPYFTETIPRNSRSQHNGKPFSMLIPGNRLHIVSSKEHWDELNKTSVDHLSSHAWSKQHFQPKHTFGYEWPDRRDEDGMPVVRAIRTMTGRFQELTPKYLRIMEEEIKEALEKGRREDGRSIAQCCWSCLELF